LGFPSVPSGVLIEPYPVQSRGVCRLEARIEIGSFLPTRICGGNHGNFIHFSPQANRRHLITGAAAIAISSQLWK